MDEVVFLDANIFLEVMLGDANHQSCRALFNRILAGEVQACTSDFIVYSCLLQIHAKAKDPHLMEKFVLFLNSTPNLRVVRCSLSEMAAAVSCMERYRLDFDDALVVSAMAHRNMDTLISFDRDFDSVPIIKRSVP